MAWIWITFNGKTRAVYLPLDNEYRCDITPILEELNITVDQALTTILETPDIYQTLERYACDERNFLRWQILVSLHERIPQLFNLIHGDNRSKLLIQYGFLPVIFNALHLPNYTDVSVTCEAHFKQVAQTDDNFYAWQADLKLAVEAFSVGGNSNLKTYFQKTLELYQYDD